jgi:SAM-dependent methyltransferase
MKEKNIQELLTYHNFSSASPIFSQLLEDPSILGMDRGFMADKSPDQRRDVIIGEYLLKLSEELGGMASQLLMRGQWGYELPDWFDHRHHTLDWEAQSKNNWLESASLVLRLLPDKGTLLDLCAGDAFFDFRFFRQVCSEITCVDINSSNEYKNYIIKKHAAPNIDYIFEDVLKYQPRFGHYDVVWMRSSIEHFNQRDQKILFEKIKRALKPGGWYCGDTPANPDKSQAKQHSAHENEWGDVREAEETLRASFEEVHVYSLYCNRDKRTTLFWYCR